MTKRSTHRRSSSSGTGRGLGQKSSPKRRKAAKSEASGKRYGLTEKGAVASSSPPRRKPPIQK